MQVPDLDLRHDDAVLTVDCADDGFDGEVSVTAGQPGNDSGIALIGPPPWLPVAAVLLVAAGAGIVTATVRLRSGRR